MGLWQAGPGKEVEHLAKRNEWDVKATLGRAASCSALGRWTQAHLWGQSGQVRLGTAAVRCEG